MRYNCVKITL